MPNPTILHRLLFILSISLQPIAAAQVEHAYVKSEYVSGNNKTTYQGVGENDRLEAGSIAKYACTLAVLRAVEEQRISLADPVAQHIANWHVQDADQVTVANVLANRSGLANNLQQVLKENPRYPGEITSSAIALQDLVADTLKFAPNGKFDYEITNWLVVQRLLESLYQQSINDILQDKVFTPAQMSKTTTFTGNLRSENAAINSAQSRPIPAFLTCAGGMETTSDNLIKLAKHHYTSFSPSTQNASMAITTSAEHYALGGRFKLAMIAGEPQWISHQSGKNGDFSSAVVYIPSLDKGFAVMTPSTHLQVGSFVTQWLAQNEVSLSTGKP